MWIPEILVRLRILGKDRVEPCHCGHVHRGKEVILPTPSEEDQRLALKAYLQWMVDDMEPTEKSEIQLEKEFFESLPEAKAPYSPEYEGKVWAFEGPYSNYGPFGKRENVPAK